MRNANASMLCLVGVAFLMVTPGALAQQKEAKVDIFPKDNRTYSQKEQDRNIADAKKGYEIVQQQKQAEAIRDKTHDSRLKLDKNTSLGGKANPPTVDVIIQTK